MQKYYILSLKRSSCSEFLVWWKTNDRGYTPDLNEAGVYTQEQIDANPDYYRNERTKPIPVEVVERLPVMRVVFTDQLSLQQLAELQPEKEVSS